MRHRWWAVGLLVLAGCATRGPLKSLDHVSNEALVIGHLQVNYNAENLTGKSALIFRLQDGDADRTSTFAADATGLIMMKMPLGRNVWTEIQCIPPGSPDPARFRFSRQDMALTLTDPNTIYYLGHLTVNWQGPTSKSEVSSAAFWFGAIGAAIAEATAKNDGKIAVALKDDLAGAQAEAEKHYPDYSLLIKKALLAVPADAAVKQADETSK
jgi:hypothetical protein